MNRRPMTLSYGFSNVRELSGSNIAGFGLGYLRFAPNYGRHQKVGETQQIGTDGSLTQRTLGVRSRT